jgi:intein/homing endonuclease
VGIFVDGGIGVSIGIVWWDRVEEVEVVGLKSIAYVSDVGGQGKQHAIDSELIFVLGVCQHW